MAKNKDPEMQISIEDLLREAEEIDRVIAEADMEPMPLEIKEEIKGNLMKKIDEYEKEKLYANLSEEDRKALEVGRKVLESKKHFDKDNMVVYRKKKIRMFHVLAAVLILVLAMGVTSMGGPEKVIEKVRVAIGTREVVRVDTEEENYVVENESEEIAYQEMKEMFGVDPVRPTQWPKGAVFEISYLEEDMQTATLIYEYEGENIYYYVSSHYFDSSWGIDNEDKVTGEYYIEQPEKGNVLIREYETIETKTKSYSIQFAHNGLEYYLMGVMNKSDFEILVKNLKFF